MRNMLKSCRTQRSLLVVGLLLSLGFNLSWNPENTHIVRNEYHAGGMVELAQTAGPAPGPTVATPGSGTGGAIGAAPVVPAPVTAAPPPTPDVGQIRDLSGFHLPGVLARIFVDPDSPTVRYMLEGNVCEHCQSIQRLESTSKNADTILAMVAESAQKLIAAQAATTSGSATTPVQDARVTEQSRIAADNAECAKKADPDDRTECRREKAEQRLIVRQEREQELLEKRKAQLVELAQSCENLESVRKSSCLSRVTSTFNTYFKGRIEQGLRAAPDSPEFQASQSMMNEFLSTLPAGINVSLMRPLFTAVENRAEMRALELQTTLQAQNLLASPALIARQAKIQAFTQLGLVSTNGIPGSNNGTLVGSIFDGITGLENSAAMVSLFHDTVDVPATAFLNNPHAQGITATGIPGALMPTSTPGLQEVPSVLAANIIAARLMRGIDLSIPGAFGTARATGVPALPSSLGNGNSNPLMNLNTIPQQQPSSPNQRTSGLTIRGG